MAMSRLGAGATQVMGFEKKAPRVRNSLIAMAGVVGGQCANFGVMFLIGKFFGPANLGQYSFLMAIAMFIGAGIGLRYELACVARESETAMMAFVHACALAAGLSVILIAIALPVYGKVSLAVVAMAFSVFLQNALGYLLNTNERYVRMAVLRLVPNLVFLLFLIVAISFGVHERFQANVFEWHAVMAVLITVGLIPLSVSYPESRGVRLGFGFFRVNHSFARYGFPTILLNSCIIYAVPIFIPMLYGKEIAGVLALAYRVGMFPVALFTQSIGAVLRRDMLDSKGAKTAFRTAGEYLVVVALVALFSTVATYVGIDVLVAKGLDGKWRDVVPFFTILAPSFMASIIFGPISQIFIVFRDQRQELLLQFGSAVAILLIFTWAWQGSLQPKVAASLLSLSTTVFAALGVLAALRLAKRQPGTS
ncbi:lipopolysaccharide biosynthesis protein [Cupriavidus oxalaticus]|uniref:Lipopolysaccharide biosynthesis protein n=1 Tax=Cupriavidus oxalaticus TaxID=96344 RepID=A0A4P7LL24_9BURK|nr:hypothetical protein [Cupriavidus oxalaticus]QBY55509.1 hypothetical protein E0W60_31310 [Cupriavidus oxalaticus]